MTVVIPVVGLQPKSTTYNCEFQPKFAVMSTTSFCNIAGMTLIHIGLRIKAIREASRIELSQSDLARSLGISPQAVQKWEDQKASPRRGKLQAIADALSISVTELIRGTEFEFDTESQASKDVRSGKVSHLRNANRKVPESRSGYLPVISWEQAAAWGPDMKKFKPADAEDWIRCPFDHGPDAFILEVGGESNYDPAGQKSYAPGEFIAVDPQRAPTNRSMVVVRIDHEERATLKQILMEGETRLLKSLNPNWPAPVGPMPPGSKIVGVVIGKWVPE
jgi:SOS-response transcriptional repressor LexA